MRRLYAAVVLGVGILLILGAVVFVETRPSVSSSPKVEILHCKGVSLMPMLLVTEQIDGFIAWQPYPALAEESGIGRQICLSGDLPPAGRWEDHPCCVLVARSDLIKDHPDLVRAFCALNIYSTEYIERNRTEASEIAAEWLMGSENFTLGKISVPSGQVLTKAGSTLKFVHEPSPGWVDLARFITLRQGKMLDVEGSSVSEGQASSSQAIFDFLPHQAALEALGAGQAPLASMVPMTPMVPGALVPRPLVETICIGYISSDLHHLPLFVAVKKWRYFNDTYGIALRPIDEGQSRPNRLELMVSGRRIGEIDLVPVNAGPTVMTLMEQNCVQLAYVGIAPAVGAIGLGADVRVIQPLQDGGSGLVVSESSPARNWTSFVSWAGERSKEGRHLKIADPEKGTIQDIMIKDALNEAGISTSALRES
jgi:NitT/TauT family transport system substrate-binding protein